MANQVLKGNPQVKQVYINSGFSGGLNATFSDDLMPNTMLRNIVNFDIESIGELTSRKGFGKNNALSELLYPAGVYHNTDVDLDLQDEVFFKLLTNTNSAFKTLADTDTLTHYLTNNGQDNVIRYLRLLVNKTAKSLYWEDVNIEIKTTPVITVKDGTITQAAFVADKTLFNFDYVDKYGRIYITNNDKGLLIFDAEEIDPTKCWTFCGSFTGKTNESYKPNAIEVRKLGFNILGTTPLSWVTESELTTETIQGVYLTTSDRKPIKIIPAGQPFQVNIFYTGDVYTFLINMLEYDTPVELTATKNTTLSVDGSLAVYDVNLLTQPSSEVEIAIDFDSELVEIETYYDYYNVGQVPASATVVEQLNVGDFKIMEMYDRLVYYKGNVVWFSEIDVYDYVPSFNYVLLPLDKSDEIVKIKFFRTNYIVFTKYKIYKLTGDFETSTFTLSKVNDNLGCVAPNSVVVVQNQLVFMSNIGLRALKTDTFRENLENILEFDEAIYPLIPGNEHMYACQYDNQYVLFYNTRGVHSTVSINMRDYIVPDVMRLYYSIGSFVSDIYGGDQYPKFIFTENGQMYSFRDTYIARFGDAYSDFGAPYTAILETKAYNFGYPAHEKKIKYAVLKLSGGEYLKPAALQVMADGEIVSSSERVASGLMVDGQPVYLDEPLEINETVPIENEMGVGFNQYYTKKVRTPARGENIALRLSAELEDRLSVQSLGFVYKLGKVR